MRSEARFNDARGTKLSCFPCDESPGKIRERGKATGSKSSSFMWLLAMSAEALSTICPTIRLRNLLRLFVSGNATLDQAFTMFDEWLLQNALAPCSRFPFANAMKSCVLWFGVDAYDKKKEAQWLPLKSSLSSPLFLPLRFWRVVPLMRLEALC